MNDKGRRLNWRQACEILGCSQAYFYRLVSDGELKAYRTKGKKRGLWVWESDVKELVEEVKDESG